MNELKEKVENQLMKSLGEIADAAVAEVKAAEVKTADPVPAAVEPDKVEGQDDLQKKYSELNEKFEALSKKLAAAPEGTEVEINKNAAMEKINDLMKSMGIDPNNVEVDFVIKEKRKGTVDNTDEKFSGSEDDKTAEGEPVTNERLSKELEGLNPEEKSEALNLYFKQVVLGK